MKPVAPEVSARDRDGEICSLTTGLGKPKMMMQIDKQGVVEKMFT